MAMTKAELQERYDALEAERDALLKAQAEFVDDVIRIAEYGAVEHDLCTELEVCLDLLGVEAPTRVITVERKVVETYEFPGFQAHRSGLLSGTDAARIAAFNQAELWGCGWDNESTLDDFRVEGEESSLVVNVAA